MTEAARIQFGRHELVRHGPRHLDIVWHGDVSENDMETLLPHLDAWGMGNRYMVLGNHVADLGRFDAAARRRMAQFRFTNEDAVETFILVVGAKVMQRAIMTLVITASRLTTHAKIISEYVDDPATAKAHVRAYLEQHPE